MRQCAGMVVFVVWDLRCWRIAVCSALILCGVPRWRKRKKERERSATRNKKQRPLKKKKYPPATGESAYVWVGNVGATSVALNERRAFFPLRRRNMFLQEFLLMRSFVWFALFIRSRQSSMMAWSSVSVSVCYSGPFAFGAVRDCHQRERKNPQQDRNESCDAIAGSSHSRRVLNSAEANNCTRFNSIHEPFPQLALTPRFGIHLCSAGRLRVTRLVCLCVCVCVRVRQGGVLQPSAESTRRITLCNVETYLSGKCAL